MFNPSMNELPRALQLMLERDTSPAAATELPRRSFLKLGAASGFALGIFPLAAQAQATNPDSPVRLNPRNITANLTIPSAYNAASVGPITVADGITVTVQDNATWSIH